MAKAKAIEVTDETKNTAPSVVAGMGPKTRQEYDVLIERWKKENPSQVSDEKLAHIERLRKLLPEAQE